MAHYDMLVIGSGPAGQKAAIQAAKVGKKVGDHRAKKSRRRYLHKYRHDSEQVFARGGHVSLRISPERSLRRQLSGQKRYHLPGPALSVIMWSKPSRKSFKTN